MFASPGRGIKLAGLHARVPTGPGFSPLQLLWVLRESARQAGPCVTQAAVPTGRGRTVPLTPSLQCPRAEDVENLPLLTRLLPASGRRPAWDDGQSSWIRVSVRDAA